MIFSFFFFEVNLFDLIIFSYLKSLVFSVFLSYSLNWPFWPQLFLLLTELCFVYLLWKLFFFLQSGAFPDQLFLITINGYWLWQLSALDGVNALICRGLYQIHNIFVSKSLEFRSHRVIIRTICLYYWNLYT